MKSQICRVACGMTGNLTTAQVAKVEQDNSFRRGITSKDALRS